MTDKEKIHYERGTEELRMQTIRAHKLVQDFNNSAVEDVAKRVEMIKDLFGSVGVNPSIEHNFHCDLGYNIHVGDNFYAGYSYTILDMAEVRVGHNCMIGPSVGFTVLKNLFLLIKYYCHIITIVAQYGFKLLRNNTERENCET